MSATLDRSRVALSPAHRSTPHFGIAGRFGAVIERVLDWQERAAQRRHLVGLDDRMLRDIGLTRSDVMQEYRKLPWQR